MQLTEKKDSLVDSSTTNYSFCFKKAIVGIEGELLQFGVQVNSVTLRNEAASLSGMHMAGNEILRIVPDTANFPAPNLKEIC